jgi:KipI family sensor histidine kinase inhibitor
VTQPEVAGPRVEPFGDGAVLITFAGDATVASAARAQSLAARIRAARTAPLGWGAVVPAAASVLVHLDPLAADLDDTLAALQALATEPHSGDDEWPADAPTTEIAVRYGGEGGPDLVAVAEATGLTPRQVIEAHSSVEYRVLFLGFAPGFAYLGPLPDGLVIARRASPRVRVPAGSVAIGGPYTAVYPLASPGGWHLIGSTAHRAWDPAVAPEGLLAPGALVRFVPERP